MSLYIESIPNRNSSPAILLRQAQRQGKTIKRKTIANLSKLPPTLIHGIDTLLRGGVAYASIEQAVRIHRAWPHGHVTAVLGQCHKLKLPSILHSHSSRARELALAAIVARILRADSKLATARRLSPDTADSSLGRVLDLGTVGGDEMLSMLDWLLKRQPWIERKLAKRHLHSRMLILYDVTSSYVAGQCCPLAAFGYNRDVIAGLNSPVVPF